MDSCFVPWENVPIDEWPENLDLDDAIPSDESIPDIVPNDGVAASINFQRGKTRCRCSSQGPLHKMLLRHLLELQEVKDAHGSKQISHLNLQLMSAENTLQDQLAQEIRIALKILETKTMVSLSFSLS